jgi:molybdate transport system substrate-binding protein
MPFIPLTALLAAAAVAPLDEVLVLSSNGTRAVLEELAPEFEEIAGVRLVFRYAPSAELAARIEKGEAFDVAFLSRASVNDLIALGKVDAATRAAVARSGAGVAVRKGARRPDLATADAFRRALLEADSVAYVGQGVTADIMRNVFARFGIEEVMRSKTRTLSGVTAAEAVASGQAELGFTQVSEILPHPGVELAGPLPAEVQVYTTFEAVVSASSRRPQAARRWIEFVTAPSAVPVLKAKGLEPG